MKTSSLYTTCKHCDSHNIGLFKAVHKSKQKGIEPTYHYGVKCFRCNRTYYVERTGEFYKLVEYIPWSFKKHYNYALPGVDYSQLGDQVPDNLLSPGD